MSVDKRAKENSRHRPVYKIWLFTRRSRRQEEEKVALLKKTALENRMIME